MFETFISSAYACAVVRCSLKMIDTEELISHVFQRGAIWDKRLKLHANRTYVNKCWKEISIEMKVEGHLLKKKWKYLRDQYASELTKVTRPKSGAGAGEMMTSKCQYFKALSFLKEIVRPRQSSGNCSAITDSEATEDVYLQNASCKQMGEELVPSEGDKEPDDLENHVNENVTVSAIDPPATIDFEKEETQNVRRFDKHMVNRIKRERSNDYQSSILEIEKKKLEILSAKIGGKRETEEEDEHLLFFKTLLPHVKKICPEQIFPFRGRIQEVVQQFAYPVNYFIESATPTNTTPTSSTSTSRLSTSVDDYNTEPVDGNEDVTGLATFLNLN